MLPGTWSHGRGVLAGEFKDRVTFECGELGLCNDLRRIWKLELCMEGTHEVATASISKFMKRETLRKQINVKYYLQI